MSELQRPRDHVEESEDSLGLLRAAQLDAPEIPQVAIEEPWIKIPNGASYTLTEIKRMRTTF